MTGYLICLEKAMVTLSTNEEIDQYLRRMFREECQCSSKFKRTHRYIFNKLREIIGIQIPESVWFERTSQRVTPFNQQRLRWRWQQRLMELEQNSIIQVEDYDIKDETALLTYSGYHTNNCKWYVEEQIFVQDRDQVCVTILIHREFDTQNVIERKVKIKEYEDRYEDEITREFNRNTPDSDIDLDPEVVRRTTWKRDLFREEFHTIPYQPIHLEMMYSPDLPLWYKNRCSEAKEHFDSLL